MGIAIVSDIHLRKGECVENEFFQKFVEHPLVQCSETIIFLGDTFDLLLGSHPEYLVQYSFFFDFIARTISKGKTVHFFEGNHDLHLKPLFIQFFNKRKLQHDRFYYHTGGFQLPFKGWNIYLSHGDEMDATDRLYPYYRSFISSGFIKLLAEHLLTHSWIENLGQWASKKSRMRNQHKYSHDVLDTVIKEKIRQRAEKLWPLIRFDLLVCGHTHIKDRYQSQQGFLYINNGYASRENSFIHVGDDGVKFSKV